MKCCICVAIKNCGPYLNKVFENIEKIGNLFNDYKIIVYYDDSEDNTLEILKNYSINNTNLELYVNKSYISDHRTVRISTARNFCLERIRNKYSDYELFIMMDFDDVCYNDINIDILKKYLKREDWDALSFNTRPNYYDLWALSVKPYYLSLFCFEDTDDMSRLIFENINKLINNLKLDELLQCASAFNGFAIYRTNKFIDCNYDGTLRLDLLPFKRIFKKNVGNNKFIIKDFDCEHRAFHLEAINKNNARIRISPEILFN